MSTLHRTPLPAPKHNQLQPEYPCVKIWLARRTIDHA